MPPGPSREGCRMPRAGRATTQHIAGEMLQRAAGVKLVYAPFPGGAPAVNAVLGGHVGAVLGNLSEVSAQIAVRASSARSP